MSEAQSTADADGSPLPDTDHSSTAVLAVLVAALSISPIQDLGYPRLSAAVAVAVVVVGGVLLYRSVGELVDVYS